MPRSNESTFESPLSDTDSRRTADARRVADCLLATMVAVDGGTFWSRLGFMVADAILGRSVGVGTRRETAAENWNYPNGTSTMAGTATGVGSIYRMARVGIDRSAIEHRT